MLKLFYSPASPYVRKVAVIAAETGQTLEKIPASASPVARNREIAAHNPIAKVPTAIADDAGALYDSRVICRYLDETHGGAKMYPPPPALWTTLRREALADGLLDAAILLRYETALRPEEKRWPEWIDGQFAKIDASLDAMEAEAAQFEGVDAGLIAIGCALGYLDFRFADRDWRGGRPALSGWFAQFGARPSMRESAPVG